MKFFKIILLLIYFTFTITCYASDITVVIDNKVIEFDASPIIYNDRTFVPIRKIFEELGCEVEWFSETKTILATNNSKIIALQIDKKKIIITDIETNIIAVTDIDTAPILYNNRTLVPVRVISESFGYSVDWNSEQKKVIISAN